MISKLYKTKVNDVDDKGKVVIAVNAIGNEDSDGDISMGGSFDKTLNEHFYRVKWFLNHNQNILLGVPIEGSEKEGYLQMIAQFNMNKQISRETYEDYRLYAEHGKTLEHSIGVDPIKRDSTDKRKVLEWKLWEFSTLTNWGANENTPLLDIKSLKDAKEKIDVLEKMCKGNYSEDRLKQIEIQLSMLKKALQGELIVSCPYCGNQFDYNSQDEISMNSQVIEAARMYASWIIDDTVYSEMQKLAPEIQSQVEEIISTKKSIDDFVSYARCPHCYSKVSKASKIIPEPLYDTQENEEKTGGESRKSTLSLEFIQNNRDLLIINQLKK